MRLLAEELGLKAGQLFGILRVAVTGQTVSPPLFESMEIIGKEKVMRRLRSAQLMHWSQLEREKPDQLPYWLFSIFAQVSFKLTVRLKTNRPSSESGSTQKYPWRSNW